ncbi:PTS IIA-like nitrogen regulatory protein PtsN [Kingella negevensis]|uniref:PTS IIA-like nitrogen regulatory protein PtsN n=1 Tax=Kingella negevensis TaxID=1522312 RepID=UPI00050A2275|nr:PTS IIA-like nitrogen regulatory protein PtsN [Kingella negevensis]MDK4688128.1 PTS IIA-like nitrogen regulatory protein PtsN [Kingella negevensis]WII90886.1 PTS IIA-like nitrogen regulatory protein PtsN [Kingella negevensis]WII93309.1 PTS IIA-like nitrogen regulatory protein PtsN [Kingella negevensis]
MKAIGEILPLAHVVLDMETTSKKRLFEQVAQLIATESELSQTDIFDCLFARERLGSTGLGHGVAMPHGRHASIQAATGAFIRLKTPVNFDAPDNIPVSLVFVLLVPEEATSEHLEILSHLAAKFADKDTRESLLHCDSAMKAYALLTQ